MSATPTEINQCARRIQVLAPRLTSGTVLSPTLHSVLTELAADCGVPLSTRGAMSDADLISIYLVALKSGGGAIQMADKITTRIQFGSTGPLPGAEAIPPHKKRVPYDPIEDEEEPPLAQPTERDMVALADRIRAMIKEEVAGNVLAPVQASIERTTDRFFTELAKVSGEATEAALDALKPAMDAVAHKAVADALKAMTPARLDVSLHGAATVSLGLVHRSQAALITALSAGVNVYLHGPAGSGKTTGGQKCADAFMLPFYFAAKVESEYQLMGFKDAKGDTVRTPFREAYENGGVFLFDEMDASSPSAVVALNAALANGICPFPDKIVKRHPNFICIGAGNTQLTGASRAYAGRNQLDAASIDRFAFIEWDYDDHLESALATDAAWCKYVQQVRKNVKERGLNHLVTPRATYDGCKLLAKGLAWDTVADMVVYKGLDRDTVKQINPRH